MMGHPKLKLTFLMLLTLFLYACAYTPKVAVKNECGFTTGYSEEKLSERKFKVIIYTGVNWSTNRVQKILNYRSAELCKSKQATYKMIWGLAYLDGCIKSGNASNEEHWELSCEETNG
ncbi:hypothetical protein [Kangiella sp. M94]